MKLTQSDSEQTIKQLFDEYFHQLTLHAFHYVNDYGQAEEIVQDVFVKIWQNFDQIRQMNDLKAYLFKSVQNSSLNFMKHIQVRKKFIDDSEFLNASKENSHEETITEEETKKRVHQAVNKLPDNWKEAFILSKYNKLKYHEIAEDMNISQKTVEKYISKALKNLRLELKDVLLGSIFL
jgi:RNA polymerase sigma-70 factor (ECF subfamily)